MEKTVPGNSNHQDGESQILQDRTSSCFRCAAFLWYLYVQCFIMDISVYLLGITSSCTFYDEKSFLHRIIVCPILIFVFPVALVLTVLAISLFACVKQISWEFDRWKYDVCDLERGAYGKLCLKIGLQECCPYEIVIMQTDEFDNIETAKENTSLQPSPRNC